MNIFKLQPDSNPIHWPLTRELYIEKTEKKKPFFSYGDDGKMRHYAVCPACNNPVQVIGLMEQPDEGSLYAKHVPKSILGLATYRQAAYICCPLAAKNRIQAEKNAKKPLGDDLAPQILRIVKEHFDRIILVLQKSIGIFISKKLSEELLEDYIAEEGYRYRYASLLNIPWMLAYFARSKSLVGRIFFDDSMRQEILEHIPQATFSDGKLCKKEKEFLQVSVYFSKHGIQPKDNEIEESINMVITNEKNRQSSVVMKRKIVFDYEIFTYFLNIPEGKGKRNQDFLDVAGSVLNQHPLL